MLMMFLIIAVIFLIGIGAGIYEDGVRDGWIRRGTAMTVGEFAVTSIIREPLTREDFREFMN